MTADEWNEEWRGAVGTLTEARRHQNCGHLHRGRNGTCPDCSDSIDRDEA